MNLTKQYLKNCYRINDFIPFLILRYARTRPLNGKSILRRLLKKIFPVLKLRSKTFKGLILVVNPADASHLKITDEFFLEKVYNIDEIPFKPDFIIDCGSHIGMFSLLCRGLFGNVPIHMFEPNPDNLQFIDYQIAENNIQNIRVNNVAVSNYNGTVHFNNSETSFGGYISEVQGNENSYTVAVINLIEYLKKIDTKNLLIKIDIEGEEERLIPDLLPYLPLNCVLYFEYHFGLENLKKVSSLLFLSGFVVKINRVVDELYIDAVAIRKTSF